MNICRLCNGAAEHIFSCRVLQKYDVAYFRCNHCGSAQTERPYWLEEAYSKGNLADIDTGPVWRSLNSQAVIFAAARVLGLPKNAAIVDFGGGSGLLTRLLRDQGFNARWSDKYARNELASGFNDTGGQADIVCCFEVAEHLVDPLLDLAPMFQRDAQLIIIGTQTYRGQTSEWWYVSPQTGQHVFFYSDRGMAYIAQHFGYHYVHISSIHFFSKLAMSKMQGRVLWRLISPTGLKFVRAWLAFRLSAKFAWRDRETLRDTAT